MADQQPQTATERVAAHIRQQIADGTLRPGDKLLPQRQMVTLYKELYGVGETTVHAARELLKREGLVEGRPGSATVVRAPVDRRTITRLDSTGPIPRLSLARQEPPGRFGDWTWETETTDADTRIAGLLEQPVGGRIMATHYKFMRAGRYIRITSVYEPLDIVEAEPLPGHGLYQHRPVEDRMQAMGIHIGEYTERVHVRPRLASEARILGLAPGDPVLVAQSLYRDTDGRPLHLEETVLPADSSELLYRYRATHA